jgi:hypothetical protein
VLAAVCAALAATLLAGRRSPAPTGTELTLPAIADGAADGFTVTRPGQPPVTLALKDGAWRVVAPIAAPADADAVEAVTGTFAQPLASDQAVPMPAEERGQYGLGGEGVVVALRRGDAELVRFRLGKVVDGRRTYVEVAGREGVAWRVRANLLRVFDRGVDEWRDRQLFHVDDDALARLETSRGRQVRWRAVRADAKSPWRFEIPAGVEASDADVRGVAHTFATLRADAFLPDDARFAPTLRAEATTFDGRTLTVELAPTPDGAVARRAGDASLVHLPAHLVAFLDQGAEALRDRRLFDFGADRIRAVATSGAHALRLVRDEDQRWRLEAPVLINPVSPDQVMPFLEALAGLEAAGFPPDVPADAFQDTDTIELRLIDDRQVTLTLGADFGNGARYARTSLRPDRVCLVGPAAARALLPAPDAFRD